MGGERRKERRIESVSDKNKEKYLRERERERERKACACMCERFVNRHGVLGKGKKGKIIKRGSACLCLWCLWLG